jgi:hypothetical protein
VEPIGRRPVNPPCLGVRSPRLRRAAAQSCWLAGFRCLRALKLRLSSDTSEIVSSPILGVGEIRETRYATTGADGSLLLFFIAGCVFAYVPVAVLCSLPGVRFSTACGHNAYQWFILTIPLGFILAAILTIRSIASRGASRAEMTSLYAYP